MVKNVNKCLASKTAEICASAIHRDVLQDVLSTAQD
jgi:hypothetical protein